MVEVMSAVFGQACQFHWYGAVTYATLSVGIGGSYIAIDWGSVGRIGRESRGLLFQVAFLISLVRIILTSLMNEICFVVMPQFNCNATFQSPVNGTKLFLMPNMAPKPPMNQ